MQAGRRRRGPSAMRILINDKPVEELTPKLEDSLMLSRAEPEVKARVRTPAEATEFYVGQTRRWFTILATIAIVPIVVIAVVGLSSEPGDAGLLIVGALVIVCAFL